MSGEWYTSAQSLRTFQTALINAGVLEDADDIAAFNSSPQRYTEEYEAWEQAGYPNEGDDNWDEWLEAISDSEEEEEE